MALSFDAMLGIEMAYERIQVDLIHGSLSLDHPRTMGSFCGTLLLDFRYSPVCAPKSKSTELSVIIKGHHSPSTLSHEKFSSLTAIMLLKPSSAMMPMWKEYIV
jgi:hypothetical protein